MKRKLYLQITLAIIHIIALIYVTYAILATLEKNGNHHLSAALILIIYSVMAIPLGIYNIHSLSQTHNRSTKVLNIFNLAMNIIFIVGIIICISLWYSDNSQWFQ